MSQAAGLAARRNWHPSRCRPYDALQPPPLPCCASNSACVDGLHLQRCSTGMPDRALSMWRPQPPQEGLPHVLHACWKHTAGERSGGHFPPSRNTGRRQ